jgi:hypothetical protein
MVHQIVQIMTRGGADVMGGLGLGWEKGGIFFFCKKRSKKTFVIGAVLLKGAVDQGDESFLLLFFKKEALA